MKGKLTIGLFNSNDPKYNNKFCIRIEDENYKLISEIVVSPANFALATGAQACQECEIEFLQCAEVKHAEIKYRNRPTPAKFAYVKGEDGVMYYGKLYEKNDYNPVPYCSKCNKRLDDIWQNYCPYCGAKLDGLKSIPTDLELDDDGNLKNIANGGGTE